MARVTNINSINALLNICLLVFGLCPLTFAESATNKSNTIKAAYILNFINFSNWPETAFVTPREPVVVSYFGDPDFAASISKLLSSKRVHNRNIRFQHIEGLTNQSTPGQNSFSDTQRIALSLQNSHVVIFAKNQRNVANLIFNENLAPHLLSVGDDRWFAERGAMLALDQHDNRVRFYANVKAINTSAVQVSSKALRLAKLVRSK